MGVKGEKKWPERIFEETMARHFPKLVKDMNLHIQKAQHTSRRINSKIYTPRHNKTPKRQRENLKAARKNVTHHI